MLVHFGDNKIINIIDGDRGKNYPKGNDFTKIGYCVFLNTKNVTKTGFRFDEVSYISEEKDKLLRKGKLEINDVILTTRGTVGNVAIYTPSVNFRNLRINSGMVILRANDTKLIPKFLYYTLKNPLMFEKMIQFSTGSAQPQLPISIIKKIDFNLPKLDVQENIVSVLSSIDNKIELNNKINKTLEELAQTLYKHWFVDFEFPNEEGKPYKSSGGEMVDLGLGMVPKGWEIVKIKDFTSKFTTGLNPRKNFVLGLGENYYVTIKNLSNNEVVLNEKCDRINDEALNIINKRAQLEVGDILFSAIGTIGRVSYIDEYPHNWNISESLFSLRAKNAGDSYFLYTLLLSSDLQNYVQSLSQGSAQRGIRKHDFENYRFTINRDIINNFSDLIRSIYEKTFKLRRENLKLSELRDLLLPKLMSGEIEV
jgi:type I restriction enzyme, S subunit